MRKFYMAYIKSLKDGLNVIIFHFISFAFLIILYFLSKEYSPFLSVLIPILTLVISLSFILTIIFFRNPSRNITFKKNTIYAPADGVISSVDVVRENKYIMKKSCRIKIFMNLFNVHRNRAPFSGDVDFVMYKKGDLKAAFREIEDSNEQFIISLKTRFGTILLKQVAGLVARRIICNLKKGDRIKTGNIFGMIKFGSAVIIYLPLPVNMKVKKGDKVKAGFTEIAYY